MTTATAKQAMPSSRPSAPSPSARRPLTVTGAPTASRQPSFHLVAHRAPASAARRSTEQSTLPTDQPAVAHVGGDPAQQLDRVGAGQRRIGVGEALADVAETGRAEQRVGDGVGDGVAVAVPDETGHIGEHAAAEHERPLRVVAEAVDVEALADAEVADRLALTPSARRASRGPTRGRPAR